MADATHLRSLDSIDLESYKPRFTPFGGALTELTARTADVQSENPPERFSLDGPWTLREDSPGSAADAISVNVPVCVHRALYLAGRLDDPTAARNQETAKNESYKPWRYTKTFSAPAGIKRPRLVFSGVCNRCEIRLNGRTLGEHEGMFGGPVFDLTGLLEPKNTLEVIIEAIPQEYPDKGNRQNLSWWKTVVSNNVYGWHYSNMPTLGIWNSVWIEDVPDVEMPHPFIGTLAIEPAEVGLSVEFRSHIGAWHGTLKGTISPRNFKGAARSFETPVAGAGENTLGFRIRLPEAALWYPNDLGPRNLYTLSLTLEPSEGRGASYQTSFGIRTIEFAPLPGGPYPDKYNWSFVINGTPRFIKGTGWCTMDALMDLSPSKYDRFLSLAARQHCQIIRAWGAGMPETDTFYDLCDQYGVMVMQEWPTAWNSHEKQPYDVLEETVAVNTYRVRNHPSLALYCGGNESSKPFGKAIDMMGRLAAELDGARTFHRGEPWGGSAHNYDTYWGQQHLDKSVNMTADVYGEFGIACTPCAESVNRYLPPEERNAWPTKPGTSFEFHTPIFGTANDLSHLNSMIRYFVDPAACSFEQMTAASQLSQCIGLRHTLERARTRWPDCAAALYYKLNDNQPAVSWSTVDWYGAPKLGHYAVQQAFAPIAAPVLPDTVSFLTIPKRFPVYLLDDTGALRDKAYAARVRVFNAELVIVTESTFEGTGGGQAVVKLGELSLSPEQTNAAPLFIVSTVTVGGEKRFETFYLYNFEYKPGCLFTLPRAALRLDVKDGFASVTNAGGPPAVGVMIERPGHTDTFTPDENFFWLDPGETKRVAVDTPDGLRVSALNA